MGVLTAQVNSDVSVKGLPDGFVYVAYQIPSILLDVRYYITDNFVGLDMTGWGNSNSIGYRPQYFDGDVLRVC